MKTAARIITFVSAGAGILTAFICFLYLTLFTKIFDFAQSQEPDPRLTDLEVFYQRLFLYLIIAGLVSAVVAIIAGIVFSSEADPSVKKALGIVAIIIGAFANTVLLLGGIFEVVSSSREITSSNCSSSNNNNSGNGYTVYR